MIINLFSTEIYNNNIMYIFNVKYRHYIIKWVFFKSLINNNEQFYYIYDLYKKSPYFNLSKYDFDIYKYNLKNNIINYLNNLNN